MKTIQEFISFVKSRLALARHGTAAPGIKMTDNVNQPAHYTSHRSGIECIQVTEHMSFCLGNAVKYIWRAGLKGEDDIEDLRKAEWYIRREIARRSGHQTSVEGLPAQQPTGPDKR